MRQRSSVILATLLAAGLAGCAQPALDADDGADAISTVVSATVGSSSDDEPTDDSETASTAEPAQSGSYVYSGSVGGSGDYRLFELGAGSRGDEWYIAPDGSLGPFVVVLFDADKNLLMRTYMSYGRSLHHVLRADTSQVYLGVMAPIYGDGGDFSLTADFSPGQGAPALAPQVVYLNFDAGYDVQVHSRDPVSFSAFDAARLGDAYAGHTQDMKDVILQEMLADYAGLDVVILSSDDSPEPGEPHSVIHFGGDEAGLLGLADNVDNYNQEISQNAMVYTENFAPYSAMQLTPEEMSVMIANVASHELGHLLGLYHTQDPNSIMDTTGSAWDLAENQSFMRGPLEESVFATGWENSPELLARTVGTKSSGTSKTLAWRKSASYLAIRRFAAEELHSSCGTCLALDHE